MTIDEAIKHAEEVAKKQENNAKNYPKPNKSVKGSGTKYNAYLKCAEEHRQFAEWLKDYKRLLEQEPCEDAISRQAVLDINESHHGQMPNHINHQIWQEIKDLPSVNPQEPKTGQWIFHTSFDNGHKNCNECIECSQCHTWFGHDCYAKTPYCPICGAKMAESEDKE